MNKKLIIIAVIVVLLISVIGIAENNITCRLNLVEVFEIENIITSVINNNFII